MEYSLMALISHLISSKQSVLFSYKPEYNTGYKTITERPTNKQQHFFSSLLKWKPYIDVAVIY